MGRLEGKVAVVTGGGAGLGRAMAERFVAEGARVLVADLNEAGGHETVAAIGATGASDAAAFRRVDVSDEADCEGAVAEAVERWGKLDIMCANAGIGGATGRPTFISQLDKADWERVIAVNLTGAFLSAKHAFRAMQRGGGVILITASVAGLQGTRQLGAYGPSKAGAIQLMKTVALEGARFNIRCNALCPVWTQTAMVDAFVTTARAPEEVVRRRLTADIPLGRLGTPEDVAAAALYLASDEAAFINGVAFPIDGGHLAGHL